jgi:hypothetical protein
MIPPMEEGTRTHFADVFAAGGGEVGSEWKSFATEPAGGVLVPANSTVEVIFDVGELTTGFPKIEIDDGAGSSVRLTYAEALQTVRLTEAYAGGGATLAVLLLSVQHCVRCRSPG